METPKDVHPYCISIHIVGLRSCKRIRLSRSSIQGSCSIRILAIFCRSISKSRSSRLVIWFQDWIEELISTASQLEEGSDEPREVDINEIYYKAVGRKKKHRVYGLGLQGPKYYSSEISRSQVDGSTSSTITAIVQEQIQSLIPTRAHVSVPSSSPPSSIEAGVDCIDPGSCDKDPSSSDPNAASFN
ncbi:hypothetical protein PTKIN_Ptkin01aG0295000 [Pterospermum kingtungense]